MFDNSCFKITKGTDTHPFKLTITDTNLRKVLKEYFNYKMFSWVFITHEQALNSGIKDVENANKVVESKM